MTKPEVVLWMHLREDKLGGLRFRRQHAIGPYILDFYCASAKLCIEIDGSIHSWPDAMAHDERRTAWLEAQGIRVLRFAASDVMTDEGLHGVLTLIEHTSAPTTASGGPPPP